MKMDHFFAADLRRCLLSARFPALVLLTAAVCMAGFSESIWLALPVSNRNMVSGLGEIERTLTFDKVKCAMAAVLAALYAGSFVEDRKHSALRCILSRITLRQYVVCRLGTVWVGTVCTTVGGFAAACLFLKLTGLMTFRITNGNMVAMRFLPLASGRFAFCYLIILGVNFGFSVAVAAVFGMWVSTYREEKFTAVGGAVLFFYFLYAVSNYFLPELLSFETIGSRMNQNVFMSTAGVLLYHGIYLGIWYCLAGTLFYISVRRRWNRGQLV